jgi:hypothetical protein
MAADLAGTPTAGLNVQLCGDAHLSNFGGFASPERQLLFGLNDFDETLPGPFEYDLKRMAASFTIAARNNGFTPADEKAVTSESVRAYRSAMTGFAAMRTLDIWYAHMSEHDIQEAMEAVQKSTKVAAGSKTGKGKGGKKRASKGGNAEDGHIAKSFKVANKTLRKAHTRDSLQALTRYAEVADGRYRIASQPPVVVPLRDMDGAWGLSTDQIREVVEDQFRAYQASLSADRRCCWTGSGSSTWPARWSGSAASAPARSWCCCRAVTTRIRCSSRSRRRPGRSWRTTCRTAVSTLPANGSWKGNG